LKLGRFNNVVLFLIFSSWGLIGRFDSFGAYLFRRTKIVEFQSISFPLESLFDLSIFYPETVTCLTHIFTDADSLKQALEVIKPLVLRLQDRGGEE
jgi:hypothetical protein